MILKVGAICSASESLQDGSRREIPGHEEGSGQVDTSEEKVRAEGIQSWR